MKWFKHDSDALFNKKIRKLKREFHAEGYGVYFQIVELVARDIEKETTDKWGYLPSEYSNDFDFLADEVGTSTDKLLEIINFCYEIELFECRDKRLYCEEVLNRADEYTDRIIRQSRALPAQTPDSVPTNSRQHPDSVVRVSENVPLEYNRIDNNRIEKNNNNNIKEKEKEKEIEVLEKTSLSLTKTRVNHYPEIENLTDNDYEEIADHYQVPVSFVLSTREDMLLWRDGKPGNKRLEGRNWRATLMRWVKNGIVERHDKQKGDPTKRGIDARNI